MIVIDASIAIKWFVDEEGSDSAKALLYRIRDNPKEFLVPDLFFIEMLSVLSRLMKSLSSLQKTITILEELGIARVGHGHEVLEKACELTLVYSLSAYDAIYAATADLTNSIWITADKRAHQKISHLQISQLLSLLK